MKFFLPQQQIVSHLIHNFPFHTLVYCIFVFLFLHTTDDSSVYKYSVSHINPSETSDTKSTLIRLYHPRRFPCTLSPRKFRIIYSKYSYNTANSFPSVAPIGEMKRPHLVMANPPLYAEIEIGCIIWRLPLSQMIYLDISLQDEDLHGPNLISLIKYLEKQK
jgi:hypothetical protein